MGLFDWIRKKLQSPPQAAPPAPFRLVPQPSADPSLARLFNHYNETASLSEGACSFCRGKAQIVGFYSRQLGEECRWCGASGEEPAFSRAEGPSQLLRLYELYQAITEAPEELGHLMGSRDESGQRILGSRGVVGTVLAAAGEFYDGINQLYAWSADHEEWHHRPAERMTESFGIPRYVALPEHLLDGPARVWEAKGHVAGLWDLRFTAESHLAAHFCSGIKDEHPDIEIQTGAATGA